MDLPRPVRAEPGRRHLDGAVGAERGLPGPRPGSAAGRGDAVPGPRRRARRRGTAAAGTEPGLRGGRNAVGPDRPGRDGRSLRHRDRAGCRAGPRPDQRRPAEPVPQARLARSRDLLQPALRAPRRARPRGSAATSAVVPGRSHRAGRHGGQRDQPGTAQRRRVLPARHHGRAVRPGAEVSASAHGHADDRGRRGDLGRHPGGRARELAGRGRHSGAHHDQLAGAGRGPGRTGRSVRFGGDRRRPTRPPETCSRWRSATCLARPPWTR